MIYAKENPIGVDAVLADVQVRLMDLETTWGVGIDGYPRCYTGADKDGNRTINHFVSGKEYKDLVHAEGNKFFFTCENDLLQVGNGYFTTTVSLFFIVDLTKCKSGVSHRADAEVWADVADVLNTCPLIGQAERIVFGFYRVFQGYDYQDTADRQPYHYFRVDIPLLEFQLTKTYCNNI